MPESATLYIVATPIGNLADISQRALQVLAEVDLVATEDTRHSKQLLNHYGIQAKLISVHEHNENQRVSDLMQRLQSGQNIALISDAGTPLINDPGFLLVRAAREAGIRVSPIPGPSAITAALSASGLPTDCFMFSGFLPAKSKARKERLAEFKLFHGTVVVFESTHRIVDALKDIVAELGAEQRLVLAREISKRFETFLSGSAQQLFNQLEQDTDQQRGEFVILISMDKERQDSQMPLDLCLKVLLEELPVKQAAALAAKISGQSKNDAYRLALELKKE